MTDWLITGPGQPVKCPHPGCAHRLMDSGPETEAGVRIAGNHERPPRRGSIVQCKGCRRFYQYWPRDLTAA